MSISFYIVATFACIFVVAWPIMWVINKIREPFI